MLTNYVENKESKEKKETDYTINGECSHCGRCCQNTLPLSDKEIARIKNYIGKNKITPINRNNIIEAKYTDICPFLGTDNKCMIYEVRPEICRWFLCADYKNNTKPLNHRNKRIVNMLTTFSPGAYCPNAPDLNILNKKYFEKKRTVYGIV